MIKNNLKINDTFLVTVEILSPNAIIVSANINSIIYRGALIQYNATVPIIFKPNDDSKNCFSSKRQGVRDAKRNVRLKSFKSHYNLRRTNHKITKAKQIVCKLEPKDAIDDLLLDSASVTEPLSIRLKKQNGVYENVHNLTNNINDLRPLKRTIDVSSIEDDVENKLNIIKIKKIKLQSNQYRYSISTNDDDKDYDGQPLALERFVSPHFASNEFLSTSHRSLPLLSAAPLPLSLISVPIEHTPLSPNSVLTSITSPIISHTKESKTRPPLFHLETNNSNLSSPLKQGSRSSNQPADADRSYSNASTDPFRNLSRSPSIKDHTISCAPADIKSSTVSDTSRHSSPVNGSLIKLKIVKNTLNSYVIKTPNKDRDLANIALSRYNCKHFRKDDIIWAKLAGYSIWPARVLATDEDDHVIVLWLGNGHRTSRLHRQKLWDFGAHFREKFNKKAKGHYLDAVQQAQSYYAKLDFGDCAQWPFDISSESSTLESVNIDDSSGENDTLSNGHNLRTGVYLPVPDEEFELADRGGDTRSCDSSFYDCPGVPCARGSGPLLSGPTEMNI